MSDKKYCSDCDVTWNVSLFTHDFDKCPLCGGKVAKDDDEES